MRDYSQIKVYRTYLMVTVRLRRASLVGREENCEITSCKDSYEATAAMRL